MSSSYFSNSARKGDGYGGPYNPFETSNFQSAVNARFNNSRVVNGGSLSISFGKPPDTIIAINPQTGRTIRASQMGGCGQKYACGNCMYSGGYNDYVASTYWLAKSGHVCSVCGRLV